MGMASQSGQAVRLLVMDMPIDSVRAARVSRASPRSSAR